MADREASGIFLAPCRYNEFKKQIDEWIHVFRNTKPAPGTNGPLIPGDPERKAEASGAKKWNFANQAGAR